MLHIALNEVNKLSIASIGKRYLSMSVLVGSIRVTSYRIPNNHVKTVTQFGKPRYIFLQTDRKNIMLRDVNIFDDCNLSNVKSKFSVLSVRFKSGFW